MMQTVSMQAEFEAKKAATACKACIPGGPPPVPKD
jgi:hypothetical protein